jgi:hypothetical protein
MITLGASQESRNNILGGRPVGQPFFSPLCTRALCWVYNNLMGKISFSRKKKKEKVKYTPVLFNQLKGNMVSELN